MADRRTRIILDLDNNPYIRGLAQAASATKAFTKELDTSNERMSWLVQSSLALGPALVPIGAAAVPAVAALTSGLGAAAGAAGVAALAFQGVGDATKAANDYAIEPSADNLNELRAALERLGPAGQEFVLFLQDLKPRLQELRETAQAGLFPGVQDGITALMQRAPQVERIIASLADTMGDLTREAGQGLSSERFDAFFDYMETEARPILTDFGRAFGNLIEGVANMMVGFGPLTDQFTGGLLNMSREFANWTRTLDQNRSFQNFLAYVERVGPEVVDTFGTLVVALSDIVQAAAPVGEIVLPTIEALATTLAKVAESPAGPAIIGAAAAVSALSRSIALFNVAGGSALVGAFGRARAEGGRLGKTADTLADKFSKTGALAGGIGVLGLSFTDLDEKMGISNTAMGVMLGLVAGPWGAAIGGGIGLVKDFASANDGLEDAMNRVNRSAQGLNFDKYINDLQKAEKEARKAADAANPDNFGEFTSPAEAWRGTWETITRDARQAEQRLEDTRQRMTRNLQLIYQDVKFPEGGGFESFNMSLEDLRVFARRAEPALDQMGLELEDLETIKSDAKLREIARAIARYHREADSVPARSAKVRNAIKQLDNPMISAADSADRLEAALSGLFDPALNAEEALIAYKDSTVELRKQLNKTNGTLDINTRAGRRNREMIVGHIQATMELATAQAAQDGNSRRAIRTLKNARQTIIQAGRAAGMSEKEIRNYLKRLNFTRGTWTAQLRVQGANAAEKAADRVVNALNNINPFYETKVSAPGTEQTRSGLERLMGTERRLPDKHELNLSDPGHREVMGDLGLLQSELYKTPDKHDTTIDAPGVERTMNQIRNLSQTIFGTPDRQRTHTSAPGAKGARRDIDNLRGSIAKMRNKGVNITMTAKAQQVIDDVQKMFANFWADGGIAEYYAHGDIRDGHTAQIAPAGAMRVWAEPETGGEAYIPFAPSKRGRSREIADETVSRLGGSVLWNRDGAVYATAETHVPVDPVSEFRKIDTMFTEIATEFGKGVSSKLNEALLSMSTGFHYPLPRQYGPSGSWGTYASGGSHPALDFPAPRGTPIFSVLPGRVMHTTSLGDSYGNYSEVDHGGGLTSLYAHQQRFGVSAGDRVPAGGTIGFVNSTGNSTGDHLHLEMQRNGSSFDYTSWLYGGGPMGINLPGQYDYSGTGVSRFTPVVLDVLSALHGRRSALGSILARMEQESGGDVDVVNKWDSNWSAGTPSVGLMQVIGPTYQAYKPIPDRGPWLYGTSIDPFSNIYAGLNYARNRYGTIEAGMTQPGGYARGGMLYPGQLSYNELRQPERILDPQQTRLFGELVTTLSAMNQRRGNMLQPVQTWPDFMRNRRPRLDTPDLTRRFERILKRTQNVFERATDLVRTRQKAVNQAEKALNDAKGKAERKEARERLRNAEKRLREAERGKNQAERDRERARNQLRNARENQRTLNRAVRGFNIRPGFDRSQVASEFRELVQGVREAMGRDSHLFVALRRMAYNARQTARALDQERREREKLNDRLRELRQNSRQYASTVRGNFRNDPFSGGIDEFALQVRADRNDAKAMKRALNRASRRGLSGQLYKQLAASGNLELAQQFGRLDRGEIRYYERLFAQRQRRSRELGDRAAMVVYGDRIREQNQLIRRQNRVIDRLENRLERIEDRVGDRVERGARRGTRDGQQGKRKMLHAVVREAR